MTDRALRAWLAGSHTAAAGLDIPPDTPFEGEGYWFRRGYTDTPDR